MFVIWYKLNQNKNESNKGIHFNLDEEQSSQDTLLLSKDEYLAAKTATMRKFSQLKRKKCRQVLMEYFELCINWVWKHEKITKERGKGFSFKIFSLTSDYVPFHGFPWKEVSFLHNVFHFLIKDSVCLITVSGFA